MLLDHLSETQDAGSCAPRHPAKRLAALVAAAIAVLAVPRSASAIKTGDLLVAAHDPYTVRNEVLAIDPDTGAVRDFSPRRGSGTDLLNDGSALFVRDVASDPEGEVFVTYGAKLIEIDPATGTQHEVRGFIPQILGDFPLDLGDRPGGIAVSPIPPSGFEKRTVFVSSDGAYPSNGAVYEVDRSGLTGTGASIFASYPGGYEHALGGELSAVDAGGGQIDVWVGTSGGLLGGGAGALQPFYTEPSVTPQPSILGAREVGGVVYLSRLFGSYCSDDPSENGVYAYAYNSSISAYLLTSFATGGDLSCPGAIAAVASPFTLFVASSSSQAPSQITRVTDLQSPQSSLVVALPDQVVLGLSVYVPEPAAGLEDGAALVALLGLVLASTGSRRARP
jgi:hypothetical protein